MITETLILFGTLTTTFITPFAGATEPVQFALPSEINYAQYMLDQVHNTPFSTDPQQIPRRVAAATTQQIAQASTPTNLSVGLAGSNSCLFCMLAHCSGECICTDSKKGYCAGPVVTATPFIPPPTLPPTPTPPPTPPPSPPGRAKLEVFMTANKPCSAPNDQITFTIAVRNFGPETAGNVESTFTYKIARPGDDVAYTHATPGPADDPTDGNILWRLGALPATSVVRMTATIETRKENDAFTPPLSVQVVTAYSGGSNAITALTLPACDPEPSFLEKDLPPKAPVIICDPAEVNCVGSGPTLGARFANATPEGANLGPRFSEAIADIIPGECRVLADDVVITPEFHDAFTRFGGRFGRDPDISTAFFMQPLTNSGRDFSRLVHTNDLLGITHFSGKVRHTLTQTHQQNWQELIALVQRAIEDNNPDQAKADYNAQVSSWKSAIQQHHGDFLANYQTLQQTRKAKYDPMANTAVANATTSIARSCGQELEPYDGGLKPLLFGDPAVPTSSGVKGVYYASLDARTAVYSTTQVISLNAYAALLDGEIGARLASVTTVDELRDFLQYASSSDARIFAALVQPYNDHRTADNQADHVVRLNHWEIALDQPKTIATACERENKYGSHIELTWCESGNYPEFIISGAPEPGNINYLRPPRLIGDDPESPEGLGEDTFIDESATYGTPCGGGPGDPFWAFDCSCNCNQLVPLSFVPPDAKDPTRPYLAFCQVARDITIPISPTESFGRGNNPTCAVTCPNNQIVPSCSAGKAILNPCGDCGVVTCPNKRTAPSCEANGTPISNPCGLNMFDPAPTPAWCLPVTCPDGATVPACDINLNRFQYPCAKNSGDGSELVCQPATCPDGVQAPTCNDRGEPIANACDGHGLFTPVPVIRPATASDPTSPSGPSAGDSSDTGDDKAIFLPIVRHDIFQQLPSAELRSNGDSIDECIFESARHTAPNPLDKFKVRF